MEDLTWLPLGFTFLGIIIFAVSKKEMSLAGLFMALIGAFYYMVYSILP